MKKKSMRTPPPSLRYRAADTRVFRREGANEELTIVFSARSAWWAKRIARALNAPRKGQ